MTSIPQKKFQQLYEMALVLASVRAQHDTFQLIIDQAIALTDARYASLFLMEADSLVRICASDKKLYTITPRKKGTTYNTFKTNTPSLLHVTDITPYHPQIKALGIASDINIPLSFDGTVMGVLSVLSPASQRFTQTDLDLLTFYGPLAALAIKNSSVQLQMQQSLEARDLFISIAAHEIKTPLTSLRLYTQLLQKKADTQNTSEAMIEPTPAG